MRVETVRALVARIAVMRLRALVADVPLTGIALRIGMFDFAEIAEVHTCTKLLKPAQIMRMPSKGILSQNSIIAGS